MKEKFSTHWINFTKTLALHLLRFSKLSVFFKYHVFKNDQISTILMLVVSKSTETLRTSFKYLTKIEKDHGLNRTNMMKTFRIKGCMLKEHSALLPTPFLKAASVLL